MNEKRSFIARGIAGPAFALAVYLCATSESRAEFTVCNQTLDVVNVAIGRKTADAAAADEYVETQGWWTVGANQCVNVIREELQNKFIYVYAIDVFGQPLLTGTTPMCVGTRRFVIRDDKDCWVSGHVSAPFYEVDTKEAERWTLFLSTGGIQ